MSKTEFMGNLPSFATTGFSSVATSSSRKDIKIACISDSPKLTTGFANVARPIYQGLHEAGYELHVFGVMDELPDTNRELPYSFWHCDAGVEQLLPRFLMQIQPDIVFIIADPGAALGYNSIISVLTDKKKIKPTRVVLYTPIESYPIATYVAEMFSHIIENKGKVVLYSPGMIDLFESQYNIGHKLDFAYHGSDHASFHKYDTEKRNNLRRLCGFDKYFIIGSFGVNKRTKGFDTLIYTAQYLRSIKEDKDIKFYFHTSRNKPTLYGYNLEDLAEIYGVRDMIIFKPEKDKDYGGNIRGIDRESKEDFSKWFTHTKLTARDKKNNFSKFSFIDRLNVLDLYFDASQVEGWGLPAFEAMRCGVPTVSIDDNAVRKEIYGPSAVLIKPETFRFWTTWQTGARLPIIDPQKCGDMIVYLKNNPNKLQILSERGIENTSKFSWKDTQSKFTKIIKEVLDV